MDVVFLREVSIAARKTRSLGVARAIRCRGADPVTSRMAWQAAEPTTELSVKRVSIEVPNHSCDR